jgi:hypothetical protein
MEFFRIIETSTTQEQITELLVLKNLETISSQLILIAEPQENQVEIGSLWGEFTLSRDEIKGGLRFSLKECPNALTWTITTGYPPAPEGIVIYLTVNRKELEQEFIEEIEAFLDDHSILLKKAFFAIGLEPLTSFK